MTTSNAIKGSLGHMRHMLLKVVTVVDFFALSAGYFY